MTGLIRVSDADGVRTLSLDDAPSLNSLGESLAAELFAALRQAEADTAVRSVVLTGSGRFFCAGGNLRDFMAVTEPLDAYIGRVMAELYNPLANFLHTMETPTIAAVNGPAIGAGVGLALNADLVVMAQGAYFSLPFVPRLAVLPDMGATWLLVRGLGYSRALGLTLTGARLGADQARSQGLVWEVVADEEFAARVGELARDLARLPRGAIGCARHALACGSGNTLAEQLDVERALQIRRFASAAFREGLRAFAEKRQPEFANMDD